MKCGRELKETRIFCPECLEVMAKYPVKPGTPIQLPNHPQVPAAPVKHSRRKLRKPEEQILRLRSTIRWLVLALAVALLAFAVAVVMMLWVLEGPDFFQL